MGFGHRIGGKKTAKLYITTSSKSSAWTPQNVTNSGSTLVWKATGGITQTIIANKPTFNLSAATGDVYFEVSNVSGLTRLDVYSLNIKYIDVSKAVNLTLLYCYSNQLTALNVTNNTKLTTLHCYSNQLTALDITNNTLLTTLYRDWETDRKSVV